MPHYFTREEAEALLPAITVVIGNIQQCRDRIHTLEGEVAAQRSQAMGNGHHLFERIRDIQNGLVEQVQALRSAVNELQTLGCELKDVDTGLIDFLSLRDGEEVYLCWRLGEARILFWHPLDTGIAGRQPLE